MLEHFAGIQDISGAVFASIEKAGAIENSSERRNDELKLGLRAGQAHSFTIGWILLQSSAPVKLCRFRRLMFCHGSMHHDDHDAHVGGEQGDPLMPALYALAQQPALRDVQSQFRNRLLGRHLRCCVGACVQRQVELIRTEYDRLLTCPWLTCKPLGFSGCHGLEVLLGFGRCPRQPCAPPTSLGLRAAFAVAGNAELPALVVMSTRLRRMFLTFPLRPAHCCFPVVQ